MTAKAILIGFFAAASAAIAFPPAPHHEVFGVVRDEHGNPLAGDASVTFSGGSGDLLTGIVDPAIAPGVNYSMKVPMDAGTLTQLYQSSALRPAMPFTARVTIGSTNYVPIEVQGGALAIGDPGGRTRLDLTLGIDSDGDGLPDSWEQNIIANVDGIDDLAGVTPEGDADGDGVSNEIEYLAGTYAFDERAVFRLEILEVGPERARLRFLAVSGRSYQLLGGVDGAAFTPVDFSLTASEDATTQRLYRANSIHFQDIYVPAELVGTQLFRLSVY